MSVIEEKALKKYKFAGKIAATVREEMKKITKEGMLIIDVCEKVEEIIYRMGGKPAFPCNVSINDVAAHYTSPPDDKAVIPERGLVKIDIGVHVDGYIADTATTVCFDSEYEEMVRTAEEALGIAIKAIQPGLSTSYVGTEIQRVIVNHGYKPISNLTGHQIGRYMIHTGRSLPNISHFSYNKIMPGDVYAIEPFVTLKEAEGKVIDSPQAYIYRFFKKRSIKNDNAKQLLKYIEENFKTLPFAERWLKLYDSSMKYKPAFSSLLESKSLLTYPVFVEASHKKVAQSEHTVYIGKEEPIVLT